MDVRPAPSYLQPPENDVHHMIEDADFLTAMGEITVTDKDGKATRSAYCDVWRFRDGLLAELRAFVVELPPSTKGVPVPFRSR